MASGSGELGGANGGEVGVLQRLMGRLRGDCCSEELVGQGGFFKQWLMGLLLWGKFPVSRKMVGVS